MHKQKKFVFNIFLYKKLKHLKDPFRLLGVVPPFTSKDDLSAADRR